MFGEAVAMAVEELPVERCDRAGRFAAGLFWAITAMLAGVAHALNVAATGDVRFGRHAPAVGVLAHAEHVWEFNPFDRINIHGEIPLVYLLRLHAVE